MNKQQRKQQEDEIRKQKQEAWEKEEEQFQHDKFFLLCKFLVLCTDYQKASLDLGYGTCEFSARYLSDSSIVITQETTESRDNSWNSAPKVNSNGNHDSFRENYEKLESELTYLEQQLAERKRIEKVRLDALNKLNDEEKEVLGLPKRSW